MAEDTTRIEQGVTGDGNTAIGSIGDNSRVEIYQQQAKQNPLEPLRFGVPYQRNRYFTGRVEILERLHRQLTQETAVAISQVQAISGLGGIGKTQTAVEYAYRYFHDEQFYGYVFWVKADTATNLATDFANLAVQLALPAAQATEEEKIPAVWAWLANNNNWLLVFDNADEPELLVDWMPNNPLGKVLLTSRASGFDAVGIEQLIALDVLNEAEAVTLLVQRTGRDERDGAAALNRELDGLPLALEQAGAYIKQKRIGFESYLKLFERQGLTQLEKTKAQMGKYPSTVLKTWKLNFEAVAEKSPASSELLQLSAFFAPDDIPYWIVIAGAKHLGERLAELLGQEEYELATVAMAELLEPLSVYSLVRWDGENQRYGVHRLVQSVVRNGMEETARTGWVTVGVEALSAAYPGQEFKHWADCAALLPHWLQVRDYAHEQTVRTEALGSVCIKAGFFLNDQGRYGETEPLYVEGVALYKALLGDQHPYVATSLNDLAGLYDNQGRYETAEPLYVEALEMYKALLGDQHPYVATSLNNLAGLYQNQGRYETAEPLYVEALEMRKALLGDQHPSVATSLNDLAGLYKNQGRYETAEPLYVEALEMYKALLGDQHPSVATSLNNLAGLYQNQGRYETAEPLYVEALEMRKALLGDQHPSVATSLWCLGSLRYKQGQFEAAESLLLEALPIYKGALGSEHPNTKSLINWLNAVQAKLNRTDS